MRCRPFAVFVLVLGALGAGGCATTRVGLASVRSAQWQAARASQPGDVIANGDDSCPRAQGARADPMPYRLYRCPGRPPEGIRLASP